MMALPAQRAMPSDVGSCRSRWPRFCAAIHRCMAPNVNTPMCADRKENFKEAHDVFN
jgi:hypothetical protein